MFEMQTFFRRLESHFEANPEWYALPGKKVLTAEQYLADNRLDEWGFYKDESQDPVQWDNFREFCLNLVDSRENIERMASLRFERARQRSHQTVRELATYLDSQHRQLETPVPEKNRIMALNNKVLDEVCREAMRYPNPPEQYAAYTGWLANIENNMPERRTAIRKKKEETKAKDSSSKSGGFKNRWGTAQGQKRDRSPSPKTSKDTKEKKQDGGSSNPPCSHCNKKGHTEAKCWAKHGKPKTETKPAPRNAAAALALPPTDARSQALVCKAHIITTEGPIPVCTLIDSGAEACFID